MPAFLLYCFTSQVSHFLQGLAQATLSLPLLEVIFRVVTSHSMQSGSQSPSLVTPFWPLDPLAIHLGRFHLQTQTGASRCLAQSRHKCVQMKE